MSDPIDKLTRLGDALEGAPMPLPASAIRARGDRIRRRKHAVIAAASAAVVAAVAIPVVAFTVGDDDRDPEFTPSPSVSDPVPAGAVGKANLLTGKDAIYPTGGTVDWRERTTFEGDGQAPYSPCTETSMDGLGAQTVWQRDFDFVVTQSGEVDRTNRLNEIIAEFPSATEAATAYAEIKGWYDDCLPSGADQYDAGTFAPVPIDVDGTAEAQLSTYGPVDEEIDPFGDLGYFLETGLVLSGDRIAVLTQTIVGQDYNFDIDRRPVVQMLPAAAERLVLGDGGQVDPTDPTEGTVTEIPDGFPLTDGWPADDDSDEYQLAAPSSAHQAMVAAGDLAGCGQPAEAVQPTDRLTARLSLGSAYYSRELQLFPDTTEAARYFDSVQDSFAVCEDTGGADYSVERSGNTVALLWSEGVSRTVKIAVLDRNAVYVGIESDEGANDLDTVDRMWVGVAEGQAGLLTELQQLLDGTAGTSPGGADTAIREDFPLDAYAGDPPVPDSETTVTGPEHGLASVGDLTICGVAPLSAEPADRLGYRVVGIEWGERRELRTYENEEQAVDQLQALRDALAACPRESLEGGADRVFEVFGQGEETGYDSVTFGYTLVQTNGSPLTGGELFTVLRRGSAILLVAESAEHSGPSLAGAVPAFLDDIDVITPSMCEFTEDGCQ